MDYLKARVDQIRTRVSDDREDLIRESRRKIAAAASTLFRKKGFHQTSTSDIAKEIGVSQGHLYQYILKKQDILLLMLDIAAEEYSEKLFSIAERTESPVERLKIAISTYYHILDDHHNTTSALYSHAVDLDAKDRRILDNVEVDVTNLFKSIIDKGIEAGDFDPTDSFVVAFNIVSLGHMWALKRNRFRGLLNLDAYVEAQTQFVLKTLLAGDRQERQGKSEAGRKRALAAVKT